jgi:hypothetical protein
MNTTDYPYIARAAARLLADFTRQPGTPADMYMRVQVFMNEARSRAPELRDQCIAAIKHARKCFADNPIDHECAKLRDALQKIEAHAKKRQQRS